MSFLNHYDANPNYKYGEWEGCRPQKFRGGNRKHDNHPLDELDNLLNGAHLHPKPLGPSRKRFDAINTIGTDELPRPHIRPNINRNESKVCFNCDVPPLDWVAEPKLVKMPGEIMNKSNTNNEVFFYKNNCEQNSSQQKSILASPQKNNKYESYELKRPY